MGPTADSTLAGLEQTIADLGRELAERTVERDEALARETATEEVLGVINGSAGDLAQCSKRSWKRRCIFAAQRPVTF